MKIRCLFGHDWGMQENVRAISPEKLAEAVYWMPPIVLGAFIASGHLKECDRKCLRCGKIKTFEFDSRRG